MAVNKWRKYWEQGDLASFLAFYHPEFKNQGMNLRSWGEYKEKLFKSSPERTIQIDDIKVEVNGAEAIVVFKQRYLTETYRDYFRHMVEDFRVAGDGDRTLLRSCRPG